MLNNTPTEKTQYTQYNITQEDSRHVFCKQTPSGTSYIYHTALRRLYVENWSVKVENTPTFFGQYYAFLDDDGVYLGVQDA